MWSCELSIIPLAWISFCFFFLSYLSICVSVSIYIYVQIYVSMHVRTHVRAWQCICAYDKHTTKVYSIQQNFRANTYRAHRAPRKFFFYCTNIVPRLQELLRLFVKGLVDVKAAYSYDFFSNCIVLNYTSFCFRCQSFRSFSIFSLWNKGKPYLASDTEFSFRQNEQANSLTPLRAASLSPPA